MLHRTQQAAATVEESSTLGVGPSDSVEARCIACLLEDKGLAQKQTGPTHKVLYGRGKIFAPISPNTDPERLYIVGACPVD